MQLNPYLTADGIVRAGCVSDIVKYAGANQPRFDYDPITGKCRGLLIEEQRTNLITNSNPANLVSSGASATPNAGTAPDGSNSASLITVLASGSNNAHWGANGTSITTSNIYIASIFVKPNTGNPWFSFIVYTSPSTNGARAWFNVSTGVIGSSQANGAATNVTAAIQSYPNGWYRCIVSAQPNGTDTVLNWEIDLTSGNGTYQQNATAGQSMFFWGAQLEIAGAVNTATSYIPTFGSQATRIYENAYFTTAPNTYNPTQGTLYLDFDAINQNASFVIWIPTLGEVATARSPTIMGTWNGAIEVNATNSSANISTGAKYAISYSATQKNMSLSGGAVTSSQTGFNFGYSAGISGPLQIYFGSGGNNGRVINGHIRRFTYWPTLLPNTQLQQLTVI